MAKENYDGLYGLFGSAVASFDIAARAKQIRCEYNLKNKLNSLLCFVGGANLSVPAPLNP